MKLYNNIRVFLFATLMMILGVLFINTDQCFAGQRLTYSPIRQYKVLVPGTTDNVTLTISNPASSKEATEYEIEVRPFRIDNNEFFFEEKGSYSQIVNWIELPEETSGSLEPNEHKELNFKITVPDNAPAGGQYFVIVMKTGKDYSTGIEQVIELTHPVYAEVAGETIHGGEILSMEAPGFLFGGNLTAGATIRNDGNVHGNAKHILRILPLIGEDEIYTNEDMPEENTVMPESTRYTNVTWEQTPSIGVFRLFYTVEFEGVTSELSKIVIVCPVWLLLIICSIIVILIVRIVTDKKSGRRSSRHAEEE